MRGYFIPHKGVWAESRAPIGMYGWMCATLPVSYAVTCYLRTRPTIKRK